MDEPTSADALRETPLTDIHRELGARLVPFAGYAMPVQFAAGILAEHEQVRTRAGLFDVSHMGQVSLTGPSFAAAAAALETVVPGNIAGLAPGRMRYTVLLNDDGGIVDDLMVTRPPGDDDGGRIGLIVNAGGRDSDLAYLRDRLGPRFDLELHDDLALMALQGPQAVTLLSGHAPGVADLGFMAASSFRFDGVACEISRSGYTGEDGFEISLPAGSAEGVARTILDDAAALPIGLGARDSLRLEAGLCLYGHDLDETTTPIEADLAFTIAKRRREEGGFAGAERILAQLADGPSRQRIGLKLEGRAPAREGAEILDEQGRRVGTVTSGSYGPTAGVAIAMGYVEPEFAAPGTTLSVQVRSRKLAATVADMPFVPHRYFRKPTGGSPT